MEIGSLNTSTAASQLQETRKQTTTPDTQAAKERAAEAARQANDTRKQETQKEQQPRPVVNAQGQTTGTIVNTSA
jgi:hypothetical protein